MTIEQHDKIDGLGIDNDSAELVLLIADHLPWDNKKDHFTALERKIENYITFLKSNQSVEIIPQSKGLPVRIKLIHEHDIPSSLKNTMSAIEVQLADMGIRFSYSSLPSEPNS